MKMIRRTLGAMALASLAFAVLPTLADDTNPNVFVKMCDKAPDGKVSKAEVMRMVEKMFDKADTRKEGRLDKKQVEYFLKQFTAQEPG